MSKNASTTEKNSVKSSSSIGAAFSRLSLLSYATEKPTLATFNSSMGEAEVRELTLKNLNSLNTQQLIIGLPDIHVVLVPSALFAEESPNVYLEGILSEQPTNMVVQYKEIPALHASLVYGVDVHLLNETETKFPSATIASTAEALLNHWSLLAQSKKSSFIAVNWGIDFAYISAWHNGDLLLFTKQHIKTFEDIAYFVFNILEQDSYRSCAKKLLYSGIELHREVEQLFIKYHHAAQPDYSNTTIPELVLPKDNQSRSLTQLFSLILCE